MTTRPNLLLFMPDELRADAVGAFGNPVETSDVLPLRKDPRFDEDLQQAVLGR